MMRATITTLTLLAIASVLCGYNGFWEDRTQRVGPTEVTVVADGSDVRWVLPQHRATAVDTMQFAETFNRHAYDQSRSQAERCAALEGAAKVFIESLEESFTVQHSVTCQRDGSDRPPQLQMLFYPQVRHDYRFYTTFRPVY